MFKGTRPTYKRWENVLSVISQEQAFSDYLGIYPDLNKKYLSPFRKDNDPGCRFKWMSGILYFVENTRFNNKLYWSCIDVVQYIKHCSFQEALDILYKQEHIVTRQIIVTEPEVTSVPEIRFEKKSWSQNLFNLSGEVLEKEHVFCVKNYWVKVKNEWVKNGIHDPTTTLTIAYYFPNTNHVKLYFPYEHANKWYSNCSIHDIFGYHKIKYYQSKSDTLFITKSGKDRLMLDYFIGVPAIALQNEGCYLPDDIALELSVMFKNIIFLYDNDLTGISQSQKLSEKYDFKMKIIDVLPKDPFEMISEFGIQNTKKLIL